MKVIKSNTSLMKYVLIIIFMRVCCLVNVRVIPFYMLTL